MENMDRLMKALADAGGRWVDIDTRGTPFELRFENGRMGLYVRGADGELRPFMDAPRNGAGSMFLRLMVIAFMAGMTHAEMRMKETNDA